MTRFLSLVLTLVFASIASAQNSAKIQLDDGSSIRCNLIAESISIDTAYGTLAIPLTDIVRIKFGLHPTAIEAKQILDAKQGLASPVFREREIAKKTFASMGRLSMPTLRNAAKSADRDVSVNADAVMKSITESDPREASEFDSIQTPAFPVTGKIKAESFKFRSATLGEFSIPLGKIESLTLNTQRESTVSVDAAKHGNEWLSSGVTLDAGESITVKASGNVELWPQTPGQYVASPKGFNTVGKGGQFLAGALIGKIGNGSPFMIGEQATMAIKESGELRLQIVQNAWNSGSEGIYSVKISVRR